MRQSVYEQTLAQYRRGVWNALKWWLCPEWRRLAEYDAHVRQQQARDWTHCRARITGYQKVRG